MKKLISTLTLLFTSLQMFAIGEHGAWDDLNGHSEPSGFAIFFGLVILGFISFMGIAVWSSSAKEGKLDKDTNQFGCMSVIGIIVIILMIATKCT